MVFQGRRTKHVNVLCVRMSRVVKRIDDMYIHTTTNKYCFYSACARFFFPRLSSSLITVFRFFLVDVDVVAFFLFGVLGEF